MDNLIFNILFWPVRTKHRGHHGFVNFQTKDGFTIKNVGVYERLDKQGFRFVYPETVNDKGEKRSVVFPNNKDTQEAIDRELNEYLRNREPKESM